MELKDARRTRVGLREREDSSRWGEGSSGGTGDEGEGGLCRQDQEGFFKSQFLRMRKTKRKMGGKGRRRTEAAIISPKTDPVPPALVTELLPDDELLEKVGLGE